jgi:hypothetical protein
MRRLIDLKTGGVAIRLDSGVKAKVKSKKAKV